MSNPSDNQEQPAATADNRVLLHACCGPCSSACIERLRNEGKDVTVYYSDANIAPDSEYRRRRNNARKLAEEMGVPFVEDTEADHKDWLEKVAKGLENVPEGGARCRRCFEYNLRRTAAYAKAHGFPLFTTSLTVSPHKRSELVVEAGRAAGGDHFLEENFKKKEGFKRSIILAKEHHLYRQRFCGCEFSKGERVPEDAPDQPDFP